MISSILILPSSGQPFGDTGSGEALLLRRGSPAERGSFGVLAGRVGSDTAVVLPGQLVRGLATDLPGKVKPSDRLSIARFAHEDRIATDPDGAHVVVGTGSPAPTALVSPEVMDAVIDALDPAVIVSDFDALSDLGPEPVRLLDRVVTPGPMGHAVDPDWADSAASVGDDALSRAVFARLDSGEALNLRTGLYRRSRAFRAGPWGRVAALFLLCAGMGLGWQATQARATAAQAERIEADARTLYQSATGQPAPTRLSSLARGASVSDAPPTQFLDLSQTLFTAVASVPGTRVDRLSYEAGEGVLRLRLVYPGFDAAAQMEAAVAQAGGALTTGGVREQNGEFIGDAALSRVGAS